MNKLVNTWNRGFSLKNDDLRFIDASVRQALSDLANSFSSKSAIILWGCGVNYAGTVATVNEGAIYSPTLNEIFHVYEHTFVVPSPLVGDPQWCFVTAWDPAGAKTDVDLQAHQAYQIRKVVGSMTDIAGQLAAVSFANTLRVPDLLIQSADISLPTTVTLAQNRTDAIVTKQGCFAMLDLTVSIQTPTAPPNATLIGTIPEGFRPRNYLTGVCLGVNAGLDVLFVYRILTNGQVTVSPMGAAFAPNGYVTLLVNYQI